MLVKSYVWSVDPKVQSKDPDGAVPPRPRSKPHNPLSSPETGARQTILSHMIMSPTVSRPQTDEPCPDFTGTCRARKQTDSWEGGWLVTSITETGIS